MFKQSVLIFGLGLSLSLTACSQSGSDAPQTPEQNEQAKPEAPRAKQSPERRSPRGGGEGRTPPEAAYAACAELAAESACTVETSRGTRTGICRTRKGDDRAVCLGKRPEGDRTRR